MAVNNVNNNNDIARINTTNNTQQTQAKTNNNGNLAGLTVQRQAANGTKPISIAQVQQRQAQAAIGNISNTLRPAPLSISPANDPSGALRAQLISSNLTRGANLQTNNVLNNNFNLLNDSFSANNTTTTRNANGQVLNSRVNLERGAVTLFDNNGSFPPSSTATLPRTVFDGNGILSFYKNANTLTGDQLQSIQNIYANDLTSRANYQANVANLAKNLSDIADDNVNLSPTSRREINDALGSLRSAYDTLSNPTAPAPDPRALYSNIAEAYRSLKNDPAAPQSKVNTGLNILSIGASNYELNRLPVSGGTPPAAATAAANAAGAARLAAAQGQFDTVRNQPLSNAQAKPNQVFGQQVSSFLKSIGVNNVDPNKISYQVNSADQLQAIQASLPDGRQLTAIFAGGKIDSTAKVALNGSNTASTSTRPTTGTSTSTRPSTGTTATPRPATTVPRPATNISAPNLNVAPLSVSPASDPSGALKAQLVNSNLTRGANFQTNNVLNNNFNLQNDSFLANNTLTARNANGQVLNSRVNLERGAVTLFDNNGSFPPSSTATLPRTVFNGDGILSFYKNANSLGGDQLQSIQNIYANDLTSRANYQANVANLAKNLSDIADDNVNLSPTSRREINDALGSLRSAYDTLSNPTAPAPDPRALYSNVAEAYRSLKNDPAAPQNKVNTGLNILSIGASNYELNRLPVSGGTPPAAATAAANAAGAARLAAAQGQFDTVRNQPLSNAQAKPNQVFGQQVSSFLKSIGVNNVDPNRIAYQVNSADQLQAIQASLPDGRQLTAIFAGGKIDSTAKVALTAPTAASTTTKPATTNTSSSTTPTNTTTGASTTGTATKTNTTSNTTSNATAAQNAQNAARALKTQIINSRINRGDNIQVDNIASNVFNLPSDSFSPNSTRTTVTAGGQTANSTLTFGDGRGSATLFNNNGSFPPSSTATLPRTVFDGSGVLSFYKNANTLTGDQLQSIQNIYANDLTSRANYQANVANLAKNLSDIADDNVNLSPTSRREINDALGSLRSAYDTLSNPTAPAPDPRALYSNVAEAYRALRNDPTAPQGKVNTGLRILSIGASNYELNRLPVSGGTPPAAATAAANAAGAARLAAAQGQFDTVRNQPLSNAQAKPNQVFGQQVSSFLNSIGINNVDPNRIAYQVNSADQLQAIQTRLDDGRRLTVLFSGGNIDAANAKVAFR